MATRSLNVIITGDAKQLGVASKQADDHMKTVGKSAGRMSSALKVGFGAAAGAAGLLAVGLKDTVNAAIESQKSQAKLQAQLKASGISYRAHAKEIENVIQKTSRLAGLDDEDLQDAFTNLVRSTGKVNQSLKDLALVADLARAKNMDVAAAGQLVAKVHAGNTAALKRLGIALVPVTKAQDALKESTKHATTEQTRAAKAADKTATTQAALGLLQRKFAGQAAAYGKTAAGAQDRFRVAVQNLKEMIGAALLPTVTRVTNAVAKFVNGMQDGTGAGGGFARSLKNVNDTLGPIVRTGGRVVSFLVRHKNVMIAARDATVPFISAVKTLERALNAVKSAADAVVKAIGGIGRAFGAVKGAVGSVTGFLTGAGDGLGKLSGSMALPSGGAFGGSLMGARSSMRPFAAIGSRFGLNVSDGKRPAGTRTASGGISYHSSGEAIDMADGRGPDSNKLAYFKFMKSHFGGRLAELIYTPGGAGIKDGRSYQYTGNVAADHYDHVHVAFDSGAPGVGDGPGRFKGDGIGQIESLWQQAGGKRSAAAMAGAIAMAESSGQAGVSHRNSDGSIDRGLWQINSVHGSQSTLDRLGNARAAVSISGNGSNWRPWTTFTSGAYRRFLGAAQAALGGSSGSGGSGGSGGRSAPPFVSHPGSSDFAAQEHASAVRNARRRAGVRTGPAKGLTPQQLARTADEFSGTAGDTGDPNQPLIDALQADADARKALADELAANTAELKRQTDFAEGVANTSNYQLTKNLADLVSGRIVGYGVAGRAFTPGTGVDYAY